MSDQESNDPHTIEILVGDDEDALTLIASQTVEIAPDGVGATVVDSFETPGAFAFAPEAPPLTAGKGDVALAAARFAWDVVKGSRPVAVTKGAFTTVLDSREMDPLRYPNAKPFRSKLYRVRFKNIFGSVVAGVDLRCVGSHAAQKPPGSDVPEGCYLPQVAFDIAHAHAAFTTSIEAAASITAPANIGSADMVDPLVYVKVLVNYTGAFKAESKPITLKVTGRGGVVK
ncbi:MAG: hypothetical protein EA355_05800 [Rhodobacteraceae bacterium]|nr:MAG: hypothetical protein EA355_05800 [Paracoccaceae bacterium]